MAIFGFGSIWNGKEMKEDFFLNDNIVLGWNDENAKDLYSMISLLKVGDIVYLKSNKPGSRNLKVKGVGLVKKNFIHCLKNENSKNKKILNWESLSIDVKWIIKYDIIIKIPKNEGKLTNFRAATMYEEFLPYIQEEIINELIKNVK